MSILVAGGAGYIGAHVVRLLLERGEEVVVVDDLSYGTPERVKGASLVELDVASGQAPETLAEIMGGTTSRTSAAWPTCCWPWRPPASSR